MGYDFFDTDDLIEKQEGQNISQIFENEGEDNFRRKEFDLLEKISKKINAVVALGGGTLINADNRKIIQKTGYLIYLRITPETALKRLKSVEDRPLLKPYLHDPHKLLSYIESLMTQRTTYYENANMIIDADSLTPEKIVTRISKWVKKN